MVHVPKRVVDVFFSFFHFRFWMIFFFWSLVSNCRVTRVARGVFFFFWWALGWGWGYIQHGGKFCPRLDYTTGTCYLRFLLMRWEEGWKGMGGRAAGVRTLFAGNREPTEICHCWPRGVYFFCFYEVGWKSYLTLPYLCRRYR